MRIFRQLAKLKCPWTNLVCGCVSLATRSLLLAIVVCAFINRPVKRKTWQVVNILLGGLVLLCHDPLACPSSIVSAPMQVPLLFK